MFYKNYTSISIYSTLVDMAKQAGRVELIGLLVNQVRSENSNPFCHVYPQGGFSLKTVASSVFLFDSKSCIAFTFFFYFMIWHILKYGKI